MKSLQRQRKWPSSLARCAQRDSNGSFGKNLPDAGDGMAESFAFRPWTHPRAIEFGAVGDASVH
jgi:hypothetical protein